MKEEFWPNVEVCRNKFVKNERVFLIGDMNGKVGDGEIEKVVGKCGVQSVVGGNGSALLGVCVGAQKNTHVNMESGVEEGG